MARWPARRLTADQAATVTANAYLITWGQSRIQCDHRGLATRYPDEVLACCHMALVNAVLTHDPAKAMLSTWFRHRLYGEIADFRRQLRPLGYRKVKGPAPLVVPLSAVEVHHPYYCEPCLGT